MNTKKLLKVFLVCFIILNVSYVVDSQQIEPWIEVIDLDYYW